VRELVSLAEVQALAVAEALQYENPKFATEVLRTLRARPMIRGAALYNARGQLFASYVRNDLPYAELPELPGGESVTVGDDQVRVQHRIVRDNQILGTLFVSKDLGIRERVGDYAAIALAVTVAALVMSLATSIWLHHSVTKPILAIATTARQVVERRDYSVRAKATTDDEIGVLVHAFNDMLSRIEDRTEALEASKRELEREAGERAQANREIRRLNEELEARVRTRTAELLETNRQLEAFSYSVSHDLRAPLRAIDGFGQALLEDCGERVDAQMKRYLDKMRAATLRMAQLIEDLLSLSRVSRAGLTWTAVDLSALARQVLAEFAQREPGRNVDARVWDGIEAQGDARLLRIALENMIGNAWKFTSRVPLAHIEFGVLRDRENVTYFVRDNGAGFDMAYAEHLFDAFQRLHAVNDFPGTGIGLATVQRVIAKHHGRIWAHAEPGRGATFYFTLGRPEPAVTAAKPGLRETA
jgi:signal transduction histidine kinase